MPLDRYARAAQAIPAGETRSFAELAAEAGRPGAARAAGRAIGAIGTRSRLPWQRVLFADGSFARDASRAAEQLRRLRSEGARPRAGETIATWARRRGLMCVGDCASRRYATVDDERIAGWQPERVEGFAREERALARRFTHLDREPQPPPGLPELRSGKPVPHPCGLALRLARVDPGAIGDAVLAEGCVHLRKLLRAAECEALLDAGSDPARFDRATDMEPKGYGAGRYWYWKEPLPEPAASLRALLYELLLPVARTLAPRTAELPRTLGGFWRKCRAAGQRRPACILIGYGAGGRNHPHRDLYGPVSFPLQALVVLSRRGRDFEGGDFVLWREQPDGTLDATEVAADRGDLVVFASSALPARDARPRTPVLHGMRPLTQGRRYALGLVFHLAR